MSHPIHPARRSAAKLSRKLAGAAAILTVVAGSLVGAAGPASAGSNGQQIVFRDSLGIADSIRIWGYNNYGSYVGVCQSTPVHDNYISGYWWRGSVSIYGYKGVGCPTNGAVIYGTATIPTSQSGSDWTVVSDAGWGIGVG
ncbi:hypothetical protein GCM10010495_46380 [Kitasatospora herbaricolor]|uniref:hypothetical protein n=1 Tax=Kitasatospora herbaricolor TaxID=68217 RepID=UPI001748EFD1|nr:hypothetical protein [Kitasatospora herbaricolor]MDQ0312933.1 hypothetical protein [Kitasatospora herbaricolor]GGV25250.1 hypothetical protein GCM10010495_46380 [Kitasatospora herbaricolor]